MGGEGKDSVMTVEDGRTSTGLVPFPEKKISLEMACFGAV